jgi:GNAT superfamily N-acetyltransferase
MYDLSLRVQDGWGEVYTTSDGVAAALWSPPGRWQPRPESMLAVGSEFLDVLGRNVKRAARMSECMMGAHPTEPHWYLGILGTHPDWQRRGIGGALLKPILARCDAEGLPAYLESSKEANIAFYRQFGFEVTGKLALPDRGPTLWPMWRAPKS